MQDYKDEASELADMIADNRIAELAEADQDALKSLLLDETFNDFDIEITGYGQQFLMPLEIAEQEKDAQEINVDDFSLDTTCPKCGFEFNK